MEWGYEYIIPFCRRHPALPANIERERVNGYFRRDECSARDAASKLVKSMLALRPAREALYGVAAILERVAPRSRALDRTYLLLLGIAIFAGYRKGLKRFGPASGSAANASRSLKAMTVSDEVQS
jgi:hypothetical protein